MIEFSGNITGKCKNYILNREALISYISVLIASLIISVPLIVFIIYYNDFWGIIFIPIASILLFLIPFFLKEKGMSGHLGKIMPTRVVIDEDGEMVSESENFQYLRAVSQVKDMGEWYVISFYFEHRNLRFICQKSLITQGSLEEFDKMFESKIVKK